MSQSDAVSCRLCGEAKPRNEFYGRDTRCKVCVRALNNAYYHENHERRLVKKAAYREARREELAAKQRTYRNENVEERRAWDRAYGQRNAEKARERSAAWRRNNPEHAQRLRNKHATLRRVGRDALAAEYAEIVRLDPCSYCGGPSGEVDHIDPASIVGHNGWENLTAACRRCNARKNASPLLVYLART